MARFRYRREIRDRQEIHHVLMRYCRGVDRGDVELLRSVYHPGANDDHGRFKGSGAEFADYIVKSMDAVGGVGQHHITNYLIELGGDRAAVESYFIAWHPVPGDAGGSTLAQIGGRYLDRMERHRKVWAIVDRTVVVDWTRSTVLGEEWVAGSTFRRGARGVEDPSTGLFDSLHRPLGH
jgi:hypothetical protein